MGWMPATVEEKEAEQGGLEKQGDLDVHTWNMHLQMLHLWTSKRDLTSWYLEKRQKFRMFREEHI